ncbi:vinorine synthase-like [Hibiscus syriacus]|uniref:Vinorine synthase-like n=1 Tax=Hibiscus syriacus TaxID=106335 RepID=A0A6A2XZN2_HIBSY|nr:probable transcription factor At5g28040 [Hibiscus syriacus]KAE8662397.1 vinorine synthase-like [Hibiscus syriacus]
MASNPSQPFKPSASKLPIKRKAPQHEFQPIILPKPHTPPFKFQRIWSEPDEIRFLQSLLRSPSLSFPKDLPFFYSSFSHSMSHPYTKSQLSEKLRRLRKKFRVVSSRLARGLNPSSLSLHDRALFDLSRRLWGPEFASTSPFGNNSPGFSQDHEINSVPGNVLDEGGVNGNKFDGEAIDGVLGKSVMNAFDECFNEARMIFVKQGVICFDTTEKKWKEQRVSEFDALGSRLRLVIEDSLNRR